MKEYMTYSNILKSEVLTNMPIEEFEKLERIVEDICEGSEDIPSISLYEMVLVNDFYKGLKYYNYYISMAN